MYLWRGAFAVLWLPVFVLPALPDAQQQYVGQYVLRLGRRTFWF